MNLLTPREVSERLRVSLTTVYGLFDRGELSGCRIGRAVRVFSDSITDFVQRNRNLSRLPAPRPRCRCEESPARRYLRF
jgi:excisionase family DNA binding protein